MQKNRDYYNNLNQNQSQSQKYASNIPNNDHSQNYFNNSNIIEDRETRAAQNALFKIAVAVVIILVVGIAGNIFLRQQDELRRVKMRSTELAERLKVVEAEKKYIDEKTQTVNSTEELENIARNELGLLKDGEIIFKDADGDK